MNFLNYELSRRNLVKIPLGGVLVASTTIGMGSCSRMGNFSYQSDEILSPTISSNTSPRIFPGKCDIDVLALAAISDLCTSLHDLAMRRGQSALGSDSQGNRSFFAQPSWIRDYYASILHLRLRGNPVPIWDQFSGFFPCRDGWIRTHANYSHHKKRLLKVLDVPEDISAFKAAIARRDKCELETEILSAGGIAGAVRTRDEYAMLCKKSLTIPCDTYPTRYYELPTTIDPRPLSGVKIVNMSRVIAGPTAGRLLGALGADVIRIDPPHNPEILMQHLDTDFAVHSTIADFNDRDNRKAVDALLSQADGIITGYRPGSLAKFGYDDATLTQRFPQASVISLSAFLNRANSIFVRGFDSIIQAITGISATLADDTAGQSELGKPGATPVQALDMTAGLYIATSIIDDLAHNRRSTRHFTLEDLARQLLSAPLILPPHNQHTISDPVSLSSSASFYGQLDYVPPPIAIASSGKRLDYPFAPGEYGKAPLYW